MECKESGFVKYFLIILIPFILSVLGCKDDEIPILESGNTTQNKDTPGWFYSSHLSESRYIYVRLPKDYNPDNIQKKYHVIYLLDADWYFNGQVYRIENGGVVGIIDRLVEQKLIPEVILIGIGHRNSKQESTRGDDFHSPKTNSFLNFIEEDLIPAIDNRFKTDKNVLTGRTLIGHSSAGYFTLYTFFKYHKEFYNTIHNFLCFSGDFDKPIANLFEEEVTLFENIGFQKEVNMAIYFGVGGREESRFLNSYQSMKDSLTSRQYDNFRLEGHLYSYGDHGSYLEEAVKDGLLFMFRTHEK